MRHALAAVHFVLVGLDGDAGQCGIALDGLRLAQVAMPGGKPVAKQPDKIYLATGLREHVEILVMDVDVAIDVGGRGILGQNVIVREVLGPLGTVLEHGAHGRIAVDIGVFPLDVLLAGRGVGQGLVNFHEVGLGIAQLGMLRPVQDVGLGRARVIVADERLLHHVLDLFHMGEALFVQLGAYLARQEQQIRGCHLLPFHRAVGAGNGVENLDGIKGRDRTVALDDADRHDSSSWLWADS